MGIGTQTVERGCHMHQSDSHFHTKGSLESAGKEAAKGSNERGKGGEDQGVEHGRVQPHMEHLVEHWNWDWIRRVLEHGVDFTA